MPLWARPSPCSLPAHLLHNTDDSGDEGVRVLVLLGTGVQVHAFLLKHHLRPGPVRGGAQVQKDTRGAGPGREPMGMDSGRGPGNPYFGHNTRRGEA